MDKEIQSALEKYAINKTKIKSITKENEDLQIILIPALLEDPKIGETPYGKFKVSDYPSYQYSLEIKAMSDDLKAIQAKAVSTGEATVTYNPSLGFLPVKL